MGCGASCSAPDMAVNWFRGDSPESLRWQAEETGFGVGRNRSFLDHFQRKHYTNRRGNLLGELAGRLVLFNHLGKNPNYSKLPKKPHFKLTPGTKLFAKAFLGCPLGRMPIGENNLAKPTSKVDPITKHGPILLSTSPRIISIFVDVDGQPQRYEAFETSALTELAQFFRNADVKPAIPRGGIQGSFFSYVVPREQDEFFFLHFPILSRFSDCNSVDTGAFGSELVRTFVKLFSSLRPGHHKIDIKIMCYYDHCDYHYFPLDKNVNARGMWYSELFNSRLKEPHPSPQRLRSMTYPIAEGSFTVDLPPSFSESCKSLLDIRAPTEIYDEGDIEVVRKDARIVATSHCRENFDDPEGMPDVVILTSEKLERILRDAELGYRYRYDYIEIAGLWFNLQDKSPDALGTMILGCMAKGEIAPKRSVSAWTWTQPMKAGKPLNTKKIPIMNKYIKEAMDEFKNKVVEKPPPPKK